MKAISKLVIIFLSITIISSKSEIKKHEYTNLEEAIKNPKDVYYLYLRGQRYVLSGEKDSSLKEFPMEILKFSNLQELDLSFNKIRRIPDSISMLTNLVSLSLAENGLENLPSSMRNLKKLKRLNLLFNNFKKIPIFICSLDSLEYLNFINSPITDYPECILEMKNLRTLAIGGRNIDSLFMPRNKVYKLWKKYPKSIPFYYTNIFEEHN